MSTCSRRDNQCVHQRKSLFLSATDSVAQSKENPYTRGIGYRGDQIRKRGKKNDGPERNMPFAARKSAIARDNERDMILRMQNALASREREWPWRDISPPLSLSFLFPPSVGIGERFNFQQQRSIPRQPRRGGGEARMNGTERRKIFRARNR